MICIADRCGQDSRKCPCPERCGMLNEVREMRIYLEEEMQAAERIDRWGFPIAVTAVVVAVLALFVVSNWPHLSRWLALN